MIEAPATTPMPAIPMSSPASWGSRSGGPVASMSNPRPVTLTTGLPETVLDPEPGEASAALAEALGRPGPTSATPSPPSSPGGPG